MATKKKSPKPSKKAYILIKSTSIDGVEYKKGEKVFLTDEGRLVFKSKKRI